MENKNFDFGKSFRRPQKDHRKPFAVTRNCYVQPFKQNHRNRSEPIFNPSLLQLRPRNWNENWSWDWNFSFFCWKMIIFCFLKFTYKIQNVLCLVWSFQQLHMYIKIFFGQCIYLPVYLNTQTKHNNTMYIHNSIAVFPHFP
jgi:hypothetical protein